MVYGKYDLFLREVLKLPTAVFEGPSFGYTEQSAKSCFSQQVNEEQVFLTQAFSHTSEQAEAFLLSYTEEHMAGWWFTLLVSGMQVSYM